MPTNRAGLWKTIFEQGVRPVSCYVLDKWYYGDPGKPYQDYICSSCYRYPTRTKADQPKVDAMRLVSRNHWMLCAATRDKTNQFSGYPLASFKNSQDQVGNQEGKPGRVSGQLSFTLSFNVPKQTMPIASLCP